MIPQYTLAYFQYQPKILSLHISTQLSELQITFHLQLFWLQTLAVMNSKSCQRVCTGFCSLPSEVAELFDWNLGRQLFL